MLCNLGCNRQLHWFSVTKDTVSITYVKVDLTDRETALIIIGYVDKMDYYDLHNARKILMCSILRFITYKCHGLHDLFYYKAQ